VGAHLDAVITALLAGGDPTLALALAVGEILGNDLDGRVQAMAANIAWHRPQVVGLQEVSNIVVELPSPPFPTPVSISQDFLTRLVAALGARGLDYVIAAVNTNFTFDLTTLFGAPARLTDQDVLLVDRSVTLQATSNGSFPCPLCLPLGFLTIERGWARADAWIAGREVTFIVTHLESGARPEIAALRAAQAQVLAAMIDGIGHQVILMGDLNDQPGSAMSQVFAAAGFRDLWAVHGTGDGFTCCRDPDLRGGTHDQRLDYILARGGAANGPGHGAGGIRVRIVDPALPAGGPLWASDHAGLFATLPPAN
jgi:endonuclease/exonuclease/phosphatase family metal-dependent hydrolase